ncbi:Triacylglycerol lipase [Bertholletia excelsa]
MAKYFSFTASRDWLYRHRFSQAGLRSVSAPLFNDVIMHCWVPKIHRATKPTLLLLHGFGANAMWQYDDLLGHVVSHYNVYVPDLLFFGRSFTSSPERSEAFQARCVMNMMEKFGVGRMSLVGISYGGFVGYSMAAQYPTAVERLVLCCAGVCLEEKDMAEGLFRVSDLDEAARILLPQTPEKLRELMQFSYVKPIKGVPSWILSDFIQVMCTDYLQEKTELIVHILKDRKLANIPKINHSTLIIWGEEDKIFPLELGHRLKRHIGENAGLVVIEKAGHAVNLEKPKEFAKHVKAFLIDPSARRLLYDIFPTNETNRVHNE